MLIFKAKTTEGYSLKILAELLQNNIRTGSFVVDSDGIRLRMMDHYKTILIDLFLSSDNFTSYVFKSDQVLHLGINMTHFHKMLKNIKKKDSIQFFINDNDMTDLGIKVKPKDNNRTTTSFIKIQNIQNLDIELPEDYKKPVIVSASEFQKMCKGLSHISNITHISAKGFLIRFSSDAGGVMKRYTEFGEADDEDEEDEDEKEEIDYDYDEEFSTEQLTRITKLAALSSTMKIYRSTGNPLLFKSNIGTLGEISIYVKSKNLQEIESKTIEADEE